MVCRLAFTQATSSDVAAWRSRLMALLYAAFTLVLTGCLSPDKIKESQTTVLFRRDLAPTVVKRGPINLRVGDSALVEVWARLPANATRIAVTPGMRLQFLIPPGQVWTDFYIQTDALGYPHGPLALVQECFAPTKPLPDKNWFALTGAYDHPNCFPFVIGRCGEKPVTVCVEHSGELVLSPNDARSFYWNNFGRIQVVITRLN